VIFHSYVGLPEGNFHSGYNYMVQWSSKIISFPLLTPQKPQNKSVFFVFFITNKYDLEVIHVVWLQSVQILGATLNGLITRTFHFKSCFLNDQTSRAFR
jgi:hypothetical protein